MLCGMDNGTTFLFSEVDPGTTDFRTEDKLVLDVMPNPIAAPSHTTENGMVAGGCKSSACYTPGYTILAVLDNGRRHRASRATLPTGPRSMIMVRMVYNDAAPDYCDETCMRNVMWSVGNPSPPLATENLLALEVTDWLLSSPLLPRGTTHSIRGLSGDISVQ